MEKLEKADPNESKSIKDLKIGSFFQIGDDYYEVEGISKYVEDEEWEWTELRVYSVSDDSTMFLEWEEDDEIELCLTTECKVPVDTVFASFDHMVNATKTRDPIKYHGDTYRFDEKCTAIFHKDGGSNGQKVKMFDFTCGKKGLSIEKWGKGEDDYEISLCREIDFGTFKVVAL